ncbi:MAG: hypothetical protein ABSF98_22890 [Bryobacteraceae bacterium]
MLADAPFWLKVWNRGVDIAASVVGSTISAAIIAVIATFTWRWKRNRDLRFEEDKQRQQQRLEAEFAKNEKLRAASQERHNRLTQERDYFVFALHGADPPSRINEIWAAYWEWMERNELNNLPANRKIPREPPISDTFCADFEPIKRQLADLIRATELPPI